MLLSDKSLKLSEIITPFIGHLVSSENGKKVVSYGLSSYGYDVRCSNQFKIFTNVFNSVNDPKAFDERSLVSFEGNVCIIPPNSYCLATTMEYFRMPRDVTGVVTNKSTYARTGVSTPQTVLEAGWEGYLTLEIANQTPNPAKIYAYEGIAQILFFRGDAPCEISYADRKGKYQGQLATPTPARI